MWGRLTAAAAAWAIGGAAAAQGGLMMGTPAGLGSPAKHTLTLGAAGLVTPAWQGSKDAAFSIFPNVQYAYKDVLFASVQDGVGWNALRRNGWRAGPIARLRFGRREDNGGSPFLLAGGSDALRGFGDIDTAVEPGAFAQYVSLARKIRLRAELRRGFGGHEGVVGDVSGGWFNISGRTIYSLGARATFANASYTQTFFGVSPAQSARAGLPAFRTDGGPVSAGVNAVMIRPLGAKASLTAFASYDRLLPAASDSSLIRLRGELNQFTLGLAYGRRFSWN